MHVCFTQIDEWIIAWCSVCWFYYFKVHSQVLVIPFIHRACRLMASAHQHSKGRCGYPWESTLPIVSWIFLHMALYKPYILGAWWYTWLGYSPKGTHLFPLKHESNLNNRLPICQLHLKKVPLSNKSLWGLAFCGIFWYMSVIWVFPKIVVPPNHPFW